MTTRVNLGPCACCGCYCDVHTVNCKLVAHCTFGDPCEGPAEIVLVNSTGGGGIWTGTSTNDPADWFFRFECLGPFSDETNTGGWKLTITCLLEPNAGFSRIVQNADASDYHPFEWSAGFVNFGDDEQGCCEQGGKDDNIFVTITED